MLEKFKSITTTVKDKTKGNKKDYLVALDIGTEFVKALVAEVKGDRIEIIGVGRQRQGLNDMQAGAISDIAAVVNNCDKALTEAEAQANVSVRTAVIGIAGELVKGSTITVKCTRKNPDKSIDLTEMERILDLVRERAETKAKAQLEREMGGKKVDIRLVNSALVGIDIDGYPVTNPVGFQGKEVLVQLYTAFAPMIHIGALERTAQELDLDLLAVAAEPFAVSRSVLGEDTSGQMSAILMDVGGGTTDIAVIHEGGVQGTEMFGIGGRAYTRSVERELEIEFKQAEELKLGLGTNRFPSQKRPQIEKALNKTLDVWINGVELALNEFTKLDHLPNQILLCGGGSSLQMLSDRLDNVDWSKKLPFTKKPKIDHISPKEIEGILDKTEKVSDHTYITAMGLLRVGHDTILQEQLAKSGSVKEKIDRILRI